MDNVSSACGLSIILPFHIAVREPLFRLTGVRLLSYDRESLHTGVFVRQSRLGSVTISDLRGRLRAADSAAKRVLSPSAPRWQGFSG